MLELREAILQQTVLSIDKFFTCVVALLELDRGGLVLQTCYLKSFHNDLI